MKERILLLQALLCVLLSVRPWAPALAVDGNFGTLRADEIRAKSPWVDARAFDNAVFALDGSTDDLPALDNLLASVPDGGRIVFPGGKTIAIGKTWVIDGRNDLDIDFNHSTLKYTGKDRSADVLKILGSSHVTIHHLRIDGNGVARDGISFQSRQPAGGYGTSFCRLFDPLVRNVAGAAFRFGQHSLDGRDDAADRTEIHGPRAYDYRYGVFIDSQNARQIQFQGGMFGVSRGGLSRHANDVFVSRGVVEFYGTIFAGRNDGNSSWVFRIRDGAAKVYGGSSEAAIGSGTSGVIRMDGQTGGWLAHDAKDVFGSEFHGFAMRGNGTGFDPQAPADTMVWMEDGSRPLLLEGCQVHVQPNAVNRIVRTHDNAGLLTSFANSYSSPDNPFGGLSDKAAGGRVVSFGDTLTTYAGANVPLVPFNRSGSAGDAFSLQYDGTSGAAGMGRSIKWRARVDDTTTFWDTGIIGVYKDNPVAGSRRHHMTIGVSDDGGAGVEAGTNPVVRIEADGDVALPKAGKGILLKNGAGTVTRRVRLNDAGDGLVFEAP